MHRSQFSPLELGVHSVRTTEPGKDHPRWERLIVVGIGEGETLRIRWGKVSAWLYTAADNPIIDLFVDGMPDLRLREREPHVLKKLHWLLCEQEDRDALAREVRNGQEVHS